MILRACHDEKGHFGIDKTYERMREIFFWRDMEKDCITYIEGCQICQMEKMVKQKPMGWLHLLEVPKRLMEHIALDFFFDLPTGVEGWDGVMIVVDRFSKLFKLVPVKKSMELEGIIRQYMKYVYCNYELPASIVSDQDLRFNTKL
jgi:Integrase zinc binding domain